MNWRIHTFDKAIALARKQGFNDPDFDGWENLAGEDRIAIVDRILQHNGVGQIVFRHSFARAFFGADWKNQLQQLVIQPDWLQYVRDYMSQNIKEDPGLEL